MQSNNPVFRRAEGFNGQAAHNANQYGNQTYAGNGNPYAGYGSPAGWGTGQPGQPVPGGQPGYGDQGGYPTPPTKAPASTGPMTVDSVVQKSAITFGTVVIAAFITWLVTPDITSTDASGLGALYAALTIGSLGAFALSMVNSFKRVVSPALVIAFAVFEGVALGGLSKVMDAYVGNGAGTGDNIVIQAVLGTFAAFGGTLAVYKFMNIKVGQKFQTMVVAAMFGMVGLAVLDLVLSLFGTHLGLFGFGALGLLTAVVGLVLGVFMLVLDFDFVERGIAAGLPERESWRAAFAMTVSLVWIYTNLLRLLAILNDN